MTTSETLPFGEEQKIYTVGELNSLARDLLELNLGNIWLEGEISNYKLYPSGHHYFTIKDEKAEIRAVLFAGAAFGLHFRPENGMQVIANGKITIYPDRGQYQIIVESLKPAGEGKLQIAFEQLKQKLLSEGLFDSAHKKPIPQFPERIAVITSGSGAALRDIIAIIGRRYPSVEILVFPVKVQGEGAAEEISAALQSANRLNEEQPIDVMIAGRGGGSIEDLWAFNEEIVARAIFESAIPVVSAVGHEVDFTIADFVADLRAPTPSAAAELVVPDQRDLIAHSEQMIKKLHQMEQEKLQNLSMKVRLLISSYAFRRPVQRIEVAQQRLDQIASQLIHARERKFQAVGERYAVLLSKLESLNPIAVMRRGYSITEDADGNVLNSIDQVEVDDEVQVRLREGAIRCAVLAKFKSTHTE